MSRHRSLVRTVDPNYRLGLAKPRHCRRCGRLAETCIQFDPKGCVGVPERHEYREERKAG